MFDLSVIIPTRDRADTLRLCLDALAAQRLHPSRFEVLVCDDGSSDHTAAMVADFDAPYSLALLPREGLPGPAAARNRGIRAARADLVCMLNDDALLDPDGLGLHLAFHVDRAAAGLVPDMAMVGLFTFPAEFQRTLLGFLLERTHLSFRYPGLPGGPADAAGAPLGWAFCYTCNISLTRDALLRAGLFDEEFPGPAAEDMELGHRLQAMGHGFWFEPRCVAVHEHRMSAAGFCRTQAVRGQGGVIRLAKHPRIPCHYDSITRERADRLGRDLRELTPRAEALAAAVDALSATARPPEGVLADQGLQAELAGPGNYHELFRFWARDQAQMAALLDEAAQGLDRAEPGADQVRAAFRAMVVLKAFYDTLGVVGSSWLYCFIRARAAARQTPDPEALP
jgi:GT2 family glycosyltransferase